MITATTQKWLREFLGDCERSARLNDFEDGFVATIRGRFARAGNDIVISDAQWSVLRQIEDKIHAAG